MLGPGSELPILEGVQTGCKRTFGIPWVWRAVPGTNWPMLSLVLALDPGTPYGESSGGVHQGPPSCREGQRLARIAPRVRKGAQPDSRPCLPVLGGFGLAIFLRSQTCSLEAVL